MSYIPYSDLTGLEQSSIINEINRISPDIYIELGVYAGETFYKVLKNTSVFAIGIDLWEDLVVSKDNTHISQNPHMSEVGDYLVENKIEASRFRLIKGDTSKVLKSLEKKNISVIFIDGNHKYDACLKDWETAIDWIKSGSIIFHNSTNTNGIDAEYYLSDGGPFKVVSEIKESISNNSGIFKNMKFQGQFDRNAIFSNIGEGK